MNCTVAELLHFSRCPALYELHHLQGVPMPPTTRQIVSRAVRALVLEELQAKIDTGAILEAQEARQRVWKTVDAQITQDIAYTPQEAARGQRTAYEKAARDAGALLQLWRAVVARLIHPARLQEPFSEYIRGHCLSGQFEIVENAQIRTIRVRQQRPANGEAQYDMGAVVQAVISAKPVVVDYLIDSDPMVVDRQIVEFDGGKWAAIQERVCVMARCIEAGRLPPADPAYWRCQNCSLRSCCRYV